MKTKRNAKPTWTELIDALTVLCRAERGGEYLERLVANSTGGYENAEPNLSQLIARSDNPVIRMIAKQAIAAR